MEVFFMAEIKDLDQKTQITAAKNEYEIVPNQKLRHIHAYIINIVSRSFHFHNEFEIFAVLDGTATIRRSGHTVLLKPGSFVIFNSNESHKINSDSNGVTAVVLQLSKHFLQYYFPQLQNTMFNLQDMRTIVSDKISREIWSCMLELTMYYIKSEPLFELKCIGKMCHILELIIGNIPNNIINESDYLSRKKIGQRMERLFSYIDANYQYPIRLADVAEAEGVTPTYLSHFFTKNFGVSFQQYLNNIRFEHAVRLMDNRTMSIADIAAASGFSDPKYMTNMFVQKFDCKPKDFRETLESSRENQHFSATDTLQRIYADEESLELLERVIKTSL